MTHRPTSVLLVSLTLALFVALALASGVGAAASATGSVTVENGSADGYNVTVAALDPSNEPIVDPVETTVENGTFSYEPVDNATSYFVRLESEDAVYYDLADPGDEPAFVLNRRVSGTVVDESGTPVPNATVEVMSQHGPQVDQVPVTEDGSFEIGPLQPDRTYPLRIRADGAVYREVVSTDAPATEIDVELPAPTAEQSVLELSGGRPVNHLMRVGPTESGDGLFIIEILSVRNGADRPFVGSVGFAVPSNAEVVSGMVQNERVEAAAENGTVGVEASIESGETVQVAAIYRVDEHTLNKPVGYDVDEFAVMLEEYDLSQAEFSNNLVEAETGMDVPMVTNTAPLDADDRISVRVSGPPPGTANASTPAGQSAQEPESGSQPGGLPIVPLGVAFVGTIAGGIVMYRYV
jgi:hypothetical protein